MAGKFDTHGAYYWNPDKCEEILIVQAYEDIKAFIPPDQFWRNDFLSNFYERGGAVNDRHLGAINDVRRRKGLEPLVLRESRITPYMKADRPVKTEQRSKLRDHLLSLSAFERSRALTMAQQATDALEPPPLPYDEWKAQRQRGGVDERSRAETSRRLEALTTATAEAERRTVDKKLDRIKKMLALASDPGLLTQIITRLSPDEALQLADAIEDVAMRDNLIRHSLEHTACA